MRYHAQERVRDTIAATLNKIDGDVVASGSMAWEFTVRDGRAAKVLARVCGDWVSLDAPIAHISKTSPERAWKWLRFNRGLAGGARIALREDLAPVLCADIVLHDDVDLAARLRECCAGFRAAIHRVRSGDTDEPNHDETSGPCTEPTRTGERHSAELCVPEGWMLTHAGDGRWTCPLDIPGAFCQSEISLTEKGGVRLNAELAAHAPWRGPSRDAAALFLARTNELVRLGRAVLHESADGAAIAFECGFDSPPCPEELGAALSALSAGCSMMHSELQAIRNESIARAYLSALGWDPAVPAA